MQTSFVVVDSLSLIRLFCDPMGYNFQALLSTGFLCKNTKVGFLFHFLLQEIFQTQGSNPHLLFGRQILTIETLGKPANIIKEDLNIYVEKGTDILIHVYVFKQDLIHMHYTYVSKNIDINANVAKEDSK